MRFFIVDVFAERKYEGNPLAVFVVDREIGTAEMQQIAREMNYSETTFVTRERVRIFTPCVEIPFAGHPTLGTAFVIRELLGWTRDDRVVLHLGVGDIPVDFADGVLTMEQKQPAFDPIIEGRAGAAALLGLTTADLDERFPVQVVSTGLPCVILPLASSDALRRCAVNHELFRRDVKCNVLVFSSEVENELRVRVFMDDSGFAEDPATGSANGNLAAYIVEHRYFGRDAVEYRAHQGVEMGRASLLRVAAAKKNGVFTIRVGGRVIPVAEGTW